MDALMRISFRTESDATRGITAEQRRRVVGQFEREAGWRPERAAAASFRLASRARQAKTRSAQTTNEQQYRMLLWAWSHSSLDRR